MDRDVVQLTKFRPFKSRPAERVAPAAKIDTDHDLRSGTVCLSNVLELRRLSFLIAHEEGFRALQDEFDRIESELCPK